MECFIIIELPIMIAPRADLKGIQKGKLYGTITQNRLINTDGRLTESWSKGLKNYSAVITWG